MPDGVDDVVETVSVEVPGVPEESGTLIGFNERVGPPGETLAAKLTVPLKTLLPVNVIVDVLDEPWTNEREEGFDIIEKSGAGWTTKLPNIVPGWNEQK